MDQEGYSDSNIKRINQKERLLAKEGHGEGDGSHAPDFNDPQTQYLSETTHKQPYEDSTKGFLT